MKKIGVIGTGAWGTALAIHAANAGLEVSLLGRRPEIVERLAATRRHPALPGAPPIPRGVTPTTDPAQQTMFKVMPVIFMVFCYNFASGLALYSTINGLFTIAQQMVINRMPEPHLPINAGGPTGAVKNVTPKKKK